MAKLITCSYHVGFVFQSLKLFFILVGLHILLFFFFFLQIHLGQLCPGECVKVVISYSIILFLNLIFEKLFYFLL